MAEEIVGDFQGYLQTDGYAGYNALEEKEGIVHVGCLVHVRRKFHEVVKAGSKKKSGTASTVLDLIGKVYKLEKQARASAALYSLVETAKANGLNPYDYLLRVFERLPYAKGEEDIRAMLPWVVKGEEESA